MEEQYGERYAQKLEERLVHYLGELDKVLPQPTCIDQVSVYVLLSKVAACLVVLFKKGITICMCFYFSKQKDCLKKY